MSRLPDFIIIGAMKCATSTLHDQLSLQPGIFMSSPKEPNFFSDDEQYEKGIDWYKSLFAESSPDELCGESSTHYTKLPTYPLTIKRMQEVFATPAKVIYLMRDPVQRLVSQYIHQWTQRVITETIDTAIGTHTELIAYSKYAMQLEPYLATFAAQNILPVFVERLHLQPQKQFERICSFIGFQGSPQWNDDLQASNVSSQRLRSSVIRDAIVDFPPLRFLRRSLVRQALRDRIKCIWTMKDRPEISQANMNMLREIFNADLAILGSWFELDLDCDSFTVIAEQTSPQWKDITLRSVA